MVKGGTLQDAGPLSGLLDVLVEGILFVDANGTVLHANTRARDMFEGPGAPLPGRQLSDVLPGFDPSRGSAAPVRTAARGADGAEFAVEVVTAQPDPGSRVGDAADAGAAFVLAVRESGPAPDAVAEELARWRLRTETILRAATEGVIGTDAAGRCVMVNPSAARLLGHRAHDLDRRDVHELLLHSRPDGQPLPRRDSPLADTLASGRKHRVRAQTLWTRQGTPLLADVTTAPVRDGQRVVGAVMTFTDQGPGRFAAQHEQLRAVLDQVVLGGPLARTLGEADPRTAARPDARGPVFADPVLGRLADAHARMTAVVRDVLDCQGLGPGGAGLRKDVVALRGVVREALDRAVALTGVSRSRFTLGVPPIEAEVDAGRIAVALAHLFADLATRAGTDSRPEPPVTVLLSRHGELARIQAYGPPGDDHPVHTSVLRAVVAAHDGVVRAQGTSTGGGGSGSAYVVELPLGARRGTVAPPRPRPALAAGPVERETGSERAPRAELVPVRPEGTALRPGRAPTPRRTYVRPVLLWPEPDPALRRALERDGCRAAVVRSGEEIGAGRSGERPAVLLADLHDLHDLPALAGPAADGRHGPRGALAALRAAAVSADVPLLLTVGLARTAAPGPPADPGVFLTALTPRLGTRHLARALLIEEDDGLARALVQALEHHGMRAVRARTEAEAASLVAHPRLQLTLVLLNLTQARSRTPGVVEALLATGELRRTPLVAYTPPSPPPAPTPTPGEAAPALVLTHRAPGLEVEDRILGLLATFAARSGRAGRVGPTRRAGGVPY